MLSQAIVKYKTKHQNGLEMKKKTAMEQLHYNNGTNIE